MKPLRPLLIASLMLASLPAHATSFDCMRGRSLTEKLICHDPALSALDDTLGQLYWKARRRVSNRRAFLTDSDSKWAWREAHCRDTACLETWYATRIDELRNVVASLQPEGSAPIGATPPTTPTLPSKPNAPLETPLETSLTARLGAPRRATPSSGSNSAPASAQASAAALLQCTAAQPGIVVNERCSTVLKGTGNQWKREPRTGDWFCGVAMLPPAQLQAADAH